MRAQRPSLPFRVTFVLQDAGLFGGVKVVLQLAQLLQRRGFEVRVASPGEPPRWFAGKVPFVRLPALDPACFPPADVTVATYWTTIAPVAACPAGGKVHYCQGYEASVMQNLDRRGEIERAYRVGMPAFAVAPHLVALLEERFRRPARLVPPPLDTRFRPRLWPRRPHNPPRIVVFNPYEVELKGVATALQAVKLLRSDGFTCELWRVAQTPPHPEEQAITKVDRYFQGLTPPQVARVLRRCDLLLAPSWEQEGFGLPVLEAMASGVPVVASDIPAFRFVTDGTMPLVPPRQTEAFAAKALEMLSHPARWQECRRQGLLRARAFAPEKVLPMLEDALQWVASGEWRRETPPGGTQHASRD